MESADFSNAADNIADDLMRSISENDAIAVDIGMLKVSDEYTFKHSVDVATIGMVIAKKLNFSEKQIHELGIVGLYPVGCIVQLSNGETAKVVENNAENLLRPKVVELKRGKVYNLTENINCASIVIL